MNKEDYIEYWITTSNDDWSSAEDLLQTNHSMQSLFFAHLSLEKICKGLWVKDNIENHPPRIHNLVTLLEKTKIELTSNQKETFVFLNDFQVEGRYPDYKLKLRNSLTKEKATEIFNIFKTQRQWLLSKMQ